MSQSTAISAPTGDVVYNTVHSPSKAGTPPVLITEQEVLFETRVVVSPRRVSMARRFSDAVRGTVHSLHLPPPRPHYPSDTSYLEHSRMAREMDRL